MADFCEFIDTVALNFCTKVHHFPPLTEVLIIYQLQTARSILDHLSRAQSSPREPNFRGRELKVGRPVIVRERLRRRGKDLLSGAWEREF